MSLTALGWDKAHGSTSPVGRRMPKENQVVYTRKHEQGAAAFLTQCCAGFLCNVHSRDTRLFLLLLVLLYYGG